jgi:hypothetical protein
MSSFALFSETPRFLLEIAVARLAFLGLRQLCAPSLKPALRVLVVPRLLGDLELRAKISAAASAGTATLGMPFDTHASCSGLCFASVSAMVRAL